MTYDPNDTKAILDWVRTPPEERDLEAGALLLVRANRNRIFYANVLRRPEKYADKLEYELKKILQMRLDGVSPDEILALEADLLPKVAADYQVDKVPEDAPAPEQKAAFAGMRPDHDSLPEEIRNLYTVNGERYRKIRQAYFDLRKMDDLMPCDRYERLKLLAELDSAYREAWYQYDHYASPAVSADNAEAGKPQGPTASEVSAARKFISEKRKLLTTGAVPPEDVANVLAEVQERINLVLASGGGFAPDTVSVYSDMGLRF